MVMEKKTLTATEPRDWLPTMYDLPSEDPEEPGLPDEFHYFQPQLLRETFQPTTYPRDQYLVATDLNLYYDVHHTLWYKRPDWYAVLGVSRMYQGRDLRLSYVIWQEQVAPYLIVELLSPGTEREDLGETGRTDEQPPSKWTVYEQLLQIPYYVVYSRYTETVRYFELTAGRYREVHPQGQRLWLPDAGIGLGLWSGRYQEIASQWLRFYDAAGEWIQSPTEQAQEQAEQAQERAEQAQERAEQAQERAEQAQERAERLAAQLKALGIEPEL